MAQQFGQYEPLTSNRYICMILIFIGRIASILAQYPDGGQILKEILQNAGRTTHRNTL